MIADLATNPPPTDLEDGKFGAGTFSGESYSECLSLFNKGKSQESLRKVFIAGKSFSLRTRGDLLMNYI